MYNRYVPQPDGSYCRSRHPDKEPVCPPAPPCPPEPVQCCPEPEYPAPRKPVCPPPRPQKPSRLPQHSRDRQESCGLGIDSFLRQLLPNNFDTGDLIIVLLLLLMSSDCQEDQNTALLTLALYLFL